MKTRILAAIFASSILCACAASSDISGHWINNLPPQPPLTEQGIYLAPNGKAASINAQTKAYKNWNRNGNELVLTGTIVENNEIKDFSETYKIKKSEKNSLILEIDGAKIYFTKDEQASHKINQ